MKVAIMGHNHNQIIFHLFRYLSKVIVLLCLIPNFCHSVDVSVSSESENIAPTTFPNTNLHTEKGQVENGKAKLLENFQQSFPFNIDDNKALDKHMVAMIGSETFSEEGELTTSSEESLLLHDTQDSKIYEDLQKLLEGQVSSKAVDNTNKLDLDVIIQAFKFVQLDSHLSMLISQLNKMQNTNELMQRRVIVQETKLDVLLEQIKSIANFVGGESTKVNAMEDKIETKIRDMNQNLAEKIIQSSTTSQLMFELAKESLQRMEIAAKEVLNEVKAVKTEIGDVGQASIQTIYSLNKVEENLMAELEQVGNRTVYALRQDAKIIGPTVLEDGYEGNSIHFQADESKQKHPGGLHSSVKKLSPVGGGTMKAESLVSCLSRKRLINEKRPKDCGEILQFGHSRNGVYTIFPFINSDHSAKVFCDLETKGGGWTVIQRRTGTGQEARESFYRTWQEYQEGFGSPQKQYWLGLENIAAISMSGDQELMIELTDWSGEQKTAHYAYFRISNSSDNFRLHTADYSGKAGDSLSYHNGMQFSTQDHDNDLDKLTNCAEKFQGAWWYKNCHQSNLNGVYLGDGTQGRHKSYAMGITWYSWHGYYYSIRTVEMKIRSRFFSIFSSSSIK